jgi:copper homeostasis protein CutC
MENKKEILNDLILEAETNLRLYTSGQDDYAIERYNQLMELIRKIKNDRPK